ncbi:MAG: ABC transporter permease [Candidatus Saliniplasma sp.]
MVTPWERQAGTYERLLSYPVNIKAVLMRDLLAGSLFGISISTVVLVSSSFFIQLQLSTIPMLVLSVLLGAVAFSTLGVLISATTATSPSSIMMLSSLIRFPLIFISGLFIPLLEMEGAMRYIASETDEEETDRFLNGREAYFNDNIEGYGSEDDGGLPLSISTITILAVATVVLISLTVLVWYGRKKR